MKPTYIVKTPYTNEILPAIKSDNGVFFPVNERGELESYSHWNPTESLSVDGSFYQLVAESVCEAMKAMDKFPQPNYVLLKIAEEAGEVVKEGVH